VGPAWGHDETAHGSNLQSVTPVAPECGTLTNRMDVVVWAGLSGAVSRVIWAFVTPCWIITMSHHNVLVCLIVYM
jgi:hypothetical protein